MNADPTTTDVPAPGEEQSSQVTPKDLMGGVTGETETFQHYQVLRREDGSLWELGRGAMGVTYKAFDTNLRCYVALKVISAAHLHSEVAGQRFIREARVAAQVRHRNIAAVYHLGVDPNGFFYSMEFIDGETLESLVARTGPLPLETVLRIALQTARALAAASRQGLIHRDIKPANLMVLNQDEEGEDELLIKVIDFGLARSYDPGNSNAGLTATGFVGTPLYASPEQLEEHDLDVRSDIYSLGVTLWILLTGHPPFEGKMTQIITQHLTSEPPWRQLGDCPEPARALLEKMLRKDPAERFQSAGELRVAVEDCLRGMTGGSWVVSADGAEVAAAEGQPNPGQTGHYVYPAKTYPADTLEERERLAMRAAAGATLAAPVAPARASRAGAVADRRWLTGSRVLLAGAAVIFLCALAFAAWRGFSSRGTVVRADASVLPRVANPLPVSSPAVGAAPESPRPDLVKPVVAETPPPFSLALPNQPATAAGGVETGAAPTPQGTPPGDAGDDLTASASARPIPAGQPAPVESPTGAAASPTASPATAAQAMDGEDDDEADEATADKSEKNSSKTAQRTRSRRSSRRTSKPEPNFFQKLFGIKPKPKPRSR